MWLPKKLHIMGIEEMKPEIILIDTKVSERTIKQYILLLSLKLIPSTSVY